MNPFDTLGPPVRPRSIRKGHRLPRPSEAQYRAALEALKERPDDLSLVKIIVNFIHYKK